MSEVKQGGDEAETPAKPPVKGWRWGRIVLISSLALNLLFLGAVVGGGWMRHKYEAGWNGPSNYAVKRLLRRLPEEKRQVILDQVAVHRAAMRSRLRDIGKRREELKAALRAEPFDAKRVRMAAQALRAPRQEIIDARTALLVRVLEQLSPAERREMLKSHLFRHLFSRKGKWRAMQH